MDPMLSGLRGDMRFEALMQRSKATSNGWETNPLKFADCSPKIVASLPPPAK
jgi:hypothetical protein